MRGMSRFRIWPVTHVVIHVNVWSPIPPTYPLALTDILVVDLRHQAHFRQPQMKEGNGAVVKNVQHGLGIFLCFVWYWDTQRGTLGLPNLADVIEFKLVSGLLPLLLLFFISRSLYRSLRDRGVAAPYKVTFAVIFGSLVSCFIPFLFSSPVTHLLVAAKYAPFAVVVAILLALAHRISYPLKSAGISPVK
jgi:hypothetical protein